MTYSAQFEAFREAYATIDNRQKPLTWEDVYQGMHPGQEVPPALQGENLYSEKAHRAWELWQLATKQPDSPNPDVADVLCGALGTSRAHAYELMRDSLKASSAGLFTIMDSRELMECVMNAHANRGMHMTGTSNWAAHIGRAVQSAIWEKKK